MYTYCDSDGIMLEVQTFKLVMGEMFTPDASEVEEDDNSGKRGTSSNFFVNTGRDRHYDEIPCSLLSLITQWLSSAVFRMRCTGFSRK